MNGATATSQASGGKSSRPVPFINKTQEVYSYVVNHPEQNERELTEALSHLTAPVVYASLKSLVANGHLRTVETQELNKRRRPLLRFEAVPDKPYEPSYGTRRNGLKEIRMAKATSTRRGKISVRAKAQEAGVASKADRSNLIGSSDGSPIASLTLKTSSGTVQLPLMAARQLYTELKKLFEND